MASALSTVRGADSSRRSRKPTNPRFLALGVRKYGSCLLAGGGIAAVSRIFGNAETARAVGIGLLAFYATEARHVFDFPAAIDYGRRSKAATRALNRRAGGTLTILTRVLPIAAFMLFGWLANGRPRVNFAIGCMAVVLWYEHTRRRQNPAPCILDLGSTACLSIRRVGDPDAGPDPIRLLYASDLHLGTFGASRAMRELVRATVREQPHVVLLGGDLVHSPFALADLSSWIRRLRRFADVAAVPGNHDAKCLAQVASVVREAGGNWLPDRSLVLPGLRVDGSSTRKTRPDERRLLCAHHPALFGSAVALGYDLMLAGHLHGGQAILFDVRSRHYPGALYSRWTGPEFKTGATTLWVSRGVHDALPIRFRCPREVLLATFRCDARSALKKGELPAAAHD